MLKKRFPNIRKTRKMTEIQDSCLCDICVNKDECNGHYMMCPFFSPKEEEKKDDK